jgi:hypothetical protein
MFQNDLKRVLAYSTVSHLGLITLLFALNSPLAALAGVFHIMNHATFKASLFMAAGVVDHETGTRDIRRLNGLMRFMPRTGALALVASGAMAGVPLLNGFLSKEMFFAETVFLSSHPWSEVSLPVLATLAAIFAVVYSLRFGYDNIGRARTLGVEGYAVATHGRAALELGYALARTRDLDAERPLEGVPAHRFTSTLRWRDKVQLVDAFATAVFTGHRPLYLLDDPQMPTLTDRRVEIRARIGKRFRSGFGGFLGVDNLLDAGDAELDRIPPRTLYAGVEFHR